jgi:hypothetical protein
VYGPTTMVGKVCRIQMPPSSWKLIAFCLSSSSTNTRAKSVTTSEASFETLASCSTVPSGLSHSVQMLRVKVLAAAIDLMAAGTSAPMAVAAKATPANHEPPARSCRATGHRRDLAAP